MVPAVNTIAVLPEMASVASDRLVAALGGDLVGMGLAAQAGKAP